MTSPPLHLCFISRYAASLFYPQGAPAHGGSETQFYLNARELARRPGMTVDVVVEGSPDQPPETIDEVRVHRVPFSSSPLDKLRLQRLLFRINADAYLQQGIGSTTKEVAFFCLARRRRFVYWVASDFDVDPDVGRPDLNRNRWFEWGMLRADLIVAQTERQAESLRRRYGRESLLIANGFPPRQPPLDDAGRDCVLWVGRCVPIKRPELFVELARRLPELPFVMIATQGNPGAREHFESLRSRIEQTPNLRHLPGVPLREIDAWFDRARLFVNTSITEGFPNTFVQAMWSATPIASLAFDPDGMIARLGLGVAPTDDLDAFVSRIQGFLSNPAAWVEASRRAHRCACERHHLGSNMDRLHTALIALTQKKMPTRSD